MKFMVDEMLLGMVPLLEEQGHSVAHPRRYGLVSDEALVEFAKENGMIVITEDGGCAKLCRKHSVPYIQITLTEVFRHVVLPKIEALAASADESAVLPF